MSATDFLERQNSDTSVLHRVSRIVSSELSLDEMLGEIVGLAARVAGCDACLVYLVESGTEGSSYCALPWVRIPRTWAT